MGLFVKKFSEEEEKEQIIIDNNVFEGIKCEVEFPNKQLKIGTHDGFTKGFATLAFGLVGLAATSGIKQGEEKRKITTTFQITDKGIVFKKATRDGEDLRIAYENIVKSAKLNNGETFYIKLLKNQDINITHIWLKNMPRKLVIARIHLVEHIINILNERACGAQYEEVGWGLEHAIGQSSKSETKQESKSLMDELERLGIMYKEGLLTDEEFALMKQKLIAGDNEDTIMPSESIAKTPDDSCEKCGAKISSKDAFCSECGNKIQ